MNLTTDYSFPFIRTNILKKTFYKKPIAQANSYKEKGNELDDYQKFSIKWKKDSFVDMRIKKSKNESAPLIIYLHGNALNLNYISNSQLPNMVESLGDYHVIFWDYPNYGESSKAKPKPSTYVKSAQAILEYAKKNLVPNAQSTILLGRSMGTTVASHLYRDLPEDIDKIILISPWNKLACLVKRSPWILTYAGAKFVTRNHSYNNVKALSELNKPILIFSGELDKVVPSKYSEKLFQDVSEHNTDTLYFNYSDLNHSTILRDKRVWSEIKSFLDS